MRNIAEGVHLPCLNSFGPEKSLAHHDSNEAQNKDARSVGPENMRGGGIANEGCVEDLGATVTLTATVSPKELSSNPDSSNEAAEDRSGGSEGVTKPLGIESLKSFQSTSNCKSRKVSPSIKTGSST